jgi:PAS domain S-box-containing protein
MSADLALNEAAPPAPGRSRTMAALRIERSLLALRYAGFFAVIVMHAVGIESGYLPSLLWITVGAMAQNAWVHYVLYTGRHYLFLTGFNLAVHIAKVSLLVALTGFEHSPFALFYLLVIVGYSICSAHFKSIYMVAMGCAAAYSVVLLPRFLAGDIAPGNPFGMYYVGIFMCAWFMNSLGYLLRKAELEAQHRAQALASSEATLRAILDSTPSPIIVCGENELIVDVNAAGTKFLGQRREELLGQRIRSFVFDDGTLPHKFAALRTKGEYHGEAIIIAANGEERMVNFLARGFLRNNQRLFAAIFHDITEQKEVQEAARLAQLQLERVNLELRELNEMRAAFYYNLAQRLRSPLSAILGFTDMLLNEELGPLEGEQRAALQSCRRSVTRVLSQMDEAFAPETLGLRSGNGKTAEHAESTATVQEEY